MGALTAKKNRFSFRSWEPKTFKEIDDTEVKIFHIRTEHLKVKKTRILPIKYWIADKKRYSNNIKHETYPIFIFKNIQKYQLDYQLKERKNIQYLMSNIEGYNKIINKLLDQTLSKIECFFSKITPKKTLSKIKFYDEIITNCKKYERESIETFDIKNKKIFLIANPKTDSPAFNSYLYQKEEEYLFTSFGNFATNLPKEEIPYSNFNFLKIYKGKYDINDSMIINSALPNILRIQNHKNQTCLTPLYLNKNYDSFNITEKSELNLQMFHKNKKLFKNPFISLSADINANICLKPNSFDKFLQKKISHKYMERIFLLSSLLKPTKFLLSNSIESNFFRKLQFYCI